MRVPAASREGPPSGVEPTMGRSGHSLLVPFLVGGVAIVFTVAVLVGWSVMFTRYYVLATEGRHIPAPGVGYWLTLAVGCLFLLAVAAALVIFLVSNVRQSLLVWRQNTFVDSVTHELKSPLASLRLALETMQMRDIPPEMRAHFVRMMTDDVDRLQMFIDHILDAGRLESNERGIECEPVSPPALAERCVAKIRERYALPPEAIRTHYDRAAGGDTFYTDPVALEVVLNNLVDNAVKYSEGTPSVDVRVEADADMLTIAVHDEGVGIPKAELSRIFKRFYRIRHDGLHNPRGTGLGLYVVDSLVKRLGGRVEARSEGPRRGATFVARIPCQREPGGAERTAAVGKSPTARGP